GAPAGAPAGPPLPAEPIAERGVFALGASGRIAATKQTPKPTMPSPVAPVATTSSPVLAPPAPVMPPPGPRPVPHPPLPAATRRRAPVEAAPEQRSAAPQHGLLGGAYRANGAHGPEAEPKREVRALDAVFSRLAGRARASDPPDRSRRLPGVGPPGGRAR